MGLAIINEILKPTLTSSFIKPLQSVTKFIKRNL